MSVIQLKSKVSKSASRLEQHGDISIARWNALDDALCRPEVCLRGLLVDVEPAGPLWTTRTNSVSQWLEEICVPKARKKYPSARLHFPMPPKGAVVGQGSAEEPEDAKSADEKMEEVEDRCQESSN